jgi:hypothetical protein
VIDGWARVLNGAIVTVIYSILFVNSSRLATQRSSVLLFPLGALLCSYILLRSMLTALLNNGIEWRGTHYPLDQLRRNRT